jgi:plastocyanin
MSTSVWMLRRGAAGALAIAAGLAVALSCGSPNGQGSGCQSTGADVIITALDSKTFDRPSVNLVKGAAKVCWQNSGSLTHTVTASTTSLSDTSWNPSSFDQTLPPGGVVIRQFPIAGTYTYHCFFHPGMTGTINAP